MTRKKIFSYTTPKESTSGLNHIWELETVLPSSTGTIEDVDQALEVFEIVYHSHGTAVECLEDRTGHSKPVVLDRKSGMWVGA